MIRAAALLALLHAAPAVAQTMMGGTGTTTCNADFMSNVGIAIPKTPGGTDYQTVANTRYQTVFGRAECECATTDVVMQVQVTTPIPTTMQIGSVEYWTGTGCDSYTTRTNSTTIACEHYQTNYKGLSYPDYSCYTSLSVNCGSSTNRYVSIPAQALFSPVKHDCGAAANPTNNVYIVVYPQGMDQMSAPTCNLNLTESMQGPPPPATISAGAGDGAVTLNWTPAPTGTPGNAIYSFQILCADTDGNPIANADNATQAYSVCLSPPLAPGGTNGQISRRNTIYFGGTNGGGTGDGGTTTTVDAMSEPLSEPLIWTQALTMDGGTSDGGSNMVNTLVLSQDDTNPNGIDPRFICSNEILAAAATSYSKRVSGLTNNKPYQFMVLAVDNFGNVGRSPVLIATPTPTEDLWRRWYHDTGYSPGFCGVGEPLLIAGDALLVALTLLYLASRRRRA